MEFFILRQRRHLALLPLIFVLAAIAFISTPFFQHGGAERTRLAEPALLSRDDTPLDAYFDLNTEIIEMRTPNTTAHIIDRRQTGNNNNNVNDVYSCGIGNPCSNGACCGESGYCGYGSTYCGTGCTSNCDAHAPCGQYSESGDATCPLNVCCSQWGFCGTTSDFCGTGCQSNCLTPSSPGSGGDVRDTIIGYYESWKASGSTCGVMEPSQIPVEGLTGLNFAFAYIVPGTYDIVPMPGIDTDLFQQVTNQKTANPDIKVYVSIGGWTFNDNGTSTQPVFGDIASTLLKRATFANKLTQFMVQYGFDGVDLDWEYPGAPDRGGQAVDVKNYPLLLQMIQYKFRVEQKSFGISITAPTSYWYLRWFDLQDIVKYVNFINLMSYDLHGIWDSTDPIGPYVYAHTNLTEIDLALDLFWRNNISPSMINLGLAFYGRTFDLTDPSCITPGCGFSGPGPAGPCTATPGILSYMEIQNILSQNVDEYQYRYDADAAVNYLVYGETGWVSYDDKTTFQQKIDFANARGLNGLFIWAVDMDDSSFTALKAVTGKDLTPTVGQSSTLGNWDRNDCWITPCGTGCQEGWVKMTGLNLDVNGKGCPNSGKNSQQRSLCCPPWGAPDPKTCNWHGTASECYGQCLPGEMLMANDNFGGAGWCNHGVKTFCCPATGVEAAVAACQTVRSRSCPDNLPQQIGTIGVSDAGWLAYCCPAQPVFNNCSWYGNSVTCNNNRCPETKVEMATSSGGDGGLFSGCVLGRQKAFCCDPPFNGSSAILPVPLGDLFPETLPSADAPVYYEAFDHDANEFPPFDSSFTDDPNKEPFAWTIMVGAEADVQSLRRRDGSHLETFDCPYPHASDYSVQRLKAVCMVEGDDNNCEDIMIGSVRGTIIRLPEECGPDEYVRVVSFKQVEDFSLPSHLVKRVPEIHKVYEIRYDYNFRQLRRDGGEVYVRFDASDHPGYWDEIVSSSPTGPVKARSLEEHPEGWREFHMAWFEHKLSPRGYGSSDSWWLDRFNALLNRDYAYGLTKTYGFSQIIYSAQKNCAPSATASIEATVDGQLSLTLDYGLSLIGTLRNFDFSESYAYFNLFNLSIQSRAAINGNAAFSYQSSKIQLLDEWDPFGGSFNLKGIFTVGPYFDATGQIQALATISGEISAGMSIGTPQKFTYMFPQSMNVFPNEGSIYPYVLINSVNAGTSATISSAGSITLTVTPSIGFQIQLDAFGEQLVNTKVVSSFANGLTLQVGASTSGCAGAYYGIDYTIGVNIDLENPLPGWISGAQHIPVYSQTAQLRPMTCYSWEANSSSKRSLDWGLEPPSLGPVFLDPSPKALMKRVDNNNVLFPDVFGSAISCPNNINTPTGNCAVKIADYGSDPTDGGAIGAAGASKKRDLTEISARDEIFSLLAERDGKKPPFQFCGGAALMTVWGPEFPSSGDMIAAAASNPFSTYGPTTPTDCDDYGFGPVGTPPASDSLNWASEHILEWQLLGDFMSDYAANNPFTAPNPVAPSSANKFSKAGTYGICQYLKFWWMGTTMSANGFTGLPLAIVALAYPSSNLNRGEFMLLDSETNNLKERLWGTGEIRTETTMRNYINGVGDDDVNSAINVCKAIMNAVKYTQDATVSGVLVTQATRIGQWFDTMENVVAAYNDPNFNDRPYVRLNLGTAWRAWVKQQQPLADAKQKAFLAKWVPAINEAHLAPDAEGDTGMGGTEENDDIITRIAQMTDAWNAMTDWTNPFPAGW